MQTLVEKLSVADFWLRCALLCGHFRHLGCAALLEPKMLCGKFMKNPHYSESRVKRSGDFPLSREIHP